MQVKITSYQYTSTRITKISKTDMTILSAGQDVKQLKLTAGRNVICLNHFRENCLAVTIQVKHTATP